MADEKDDKLMQELYIKSREKYRKPLEDQQALYKAAAELDRMKMAEWLAANVDAKLSILRMEIKDDFLSVNNQLKDIDVLINRIDERLKHLPTTYQLLFGLFMAVISAMALVHFNK